MSGAPDLLYTDGHGRTQTDTDVDRAVEDKNGARPVIED